MELLPYLLKLTAYWLALYLCYALLLRQQTFLRWNRAYLLGSLVLGFVLPLVTYPEAAPPLPVVYQVTVSDFVVTAAAVTPSLLTWENVLWAVYLLGVVFMLGRLLRHFHQLFFFIRKGDAIDMGDHTLVLLDDDQVGSFSFLRWIVISRADYEDNFDTILNHELVHVRQRHSLDIIFLEGLRVVFWFNPILIIYKKALQKIHEYLADEPAHAHNRDGYAKFLVSYALNGSTSAVLTNQFFTSKLLKNRIAMLYKNKNSQWSLGKYAAVALFIGCTSLFVASCEREITPSAANGDVMVKGNINVTGIVNTPDHKPIFGAVVTDPKSKRKTTTDAAGRFSLKVPAGGFLEVSTPGFGVMDLQINKKYRNADYAIDLMSEGGKPGNVTYAPSADGQSVKVTTQSGEANGETIFLVVEQVPEFPGGVQEMYKFLGRNILYPTAAAKANVSGKVFVNFVVTSEGEIKDVTVLKGIGFGADEEAQRVVKSMPRWKPGMQSGKAVSVRYNMPIAFEVDNGTTEAASKKEEGVKVVTYTNGNSLIVVDGVEKPSDFSAKKLDPNAIQSMNVLKGKSATDKYGDKGANGVIEITMKK